MEQKTLSLVLKLVIVGLAAAGMIVYFAALPLLGKSLIASYPEYSRCYPSVKDGEVVAVYYVQ